jgi:branched-chain amino acid transport system permease protein
MGDPSQNSPNPPGAGKIAAAVASFERREFRFLQTIALGLLVLACALAAAGYATGDVFFQRLATEALIYAGLALSVDILLGFAGLLSLGQALFFGLGAYSSALVMKHVAPSFWLALGAGILAGAIAGAIGGVIAARVRGVYFALITYGMAQVIAKVIYNTRELGASDGIIGIPVITAPFGIFSVRADSPTGFFLVVLAFIVLVYAGLTYLARTPWGRIVSAMRINEGRLPFLGYATGPFRFGSFLLAAIIASASGAFYPMLRGFVSPELMYFEVSTNALIAVIIGGAGTLIGPIAGTVILVFGKSIVGTYTEHHLIVIGILFMATVIFFPVGLVGWARGKFRQRNRAGGPS